MIRAGSLIYALCITLILSILSCSLILLAFNSGSAVDSNLISEKQLSNVSSALNYYLTNSDQWHEGNCITIDLYQRGNDSVEIRKKTWGLFDLVFCTSHQGNKKAEGVFLIGSKPNKNLTALYLANQSKPLALCGKTVIKGNSFVPFQGVKRAYVEGQNFIGSELIDGRTQISSSVLPDLEISIQSEFLSQRTSTNEDSVIDIKYLESDKVISNSFQEKPIRLVSYGDLELDNYELRGNIVVQCKGKAIVKTSSLLEGILVYAQSIVIEQNFSGNLQAFAEDSIIVQEDVSLKYPSSLYIAASRKVNKNSRIVLMRRSTVKGNVINLTPLDVQNKSTSIQVSEECKIEGLVYSLGLIDLKGSVTGSLYCGGFVLRTPSAVYENHLLNAVINSTDLPEFYVGNFPSADVGRKAVVKRLE